MTESEKNIICQNKRKLIIDMIDSSIELAQKLGKHPLTKGCNCISCINKRKRIIYPQVKQNKYKL